MWISESIIYTDGIVELCSTPSTGFKFLHDVEIDDHQHYENVQKLTRVFKKKRRNSKQIDYFIESSKGIFESIKLDHIPYLQTQNLYWASWFLKYVAQNSKASRRILSLISFLFSIVEYSREYIHVINIQFNMLFCNAIYFS